MVADDASELRVPIVEERISIEKRDVETDRLRVRTVIDTEEVLVEERVRTGQLTVERIPVEREVATAPAPYEDGDMLVMSIVEERLVIEKRLFVVEEVRVTRSFRDEAVSVPVSLRRTRAVIERDDAEQLAAGNN